MDRGFIIYGRKSCPWCVKAEELVTAYNLPVEFISIEDGKSEFLTEEMDKRDWNTIPVIFFKRPNEELFLGGYSDLEDILGE
jgi:glutaredoxin